MSLDDRMKRAFENSRADAAGQMDAGAAFAPSERSASGPVAISLIAVLVVGLVGFGLLRSGSTVVDSDVGSSTEPTPSLDSATTEAATSRPPPTSALAVPPSLVATFEGPNITVAEDVGTPTSRTPTTTPGSQVSRGPTVTLDPASTSPTTDASAPDSPTIQPPTTEASTTTPEPSNTDGSPSFAAVENSVCESGFRARLEDASLRYVGPNEGWGRLDDLVDEQEGPFYFEAWEPGYPLDVQVEISLSETVVATAVMVAQDPFTPVSGTIDIDSSGFAGSIELEGTEGWRSLDLVGPTPTTSFFVRRSSATENIMEVLLCVTDQN